CFNHSQYRSVYNSSLRSRYLGETELTPTGLIDSSTDSSDDGKAKPAVGSVNTDPATHGPSGGLQSSSTLSQQASTSSDNPSRSGELSEASKANLALVANAGSGRGKEPNIVDKTEQEGDGNPASDSQTEERGTDPDVSHEAPKDTEGTNSLPTPPPDNATEAEVANAGEGTAVVLTTNEGPTGNPETESENEQHSSANDVSEQPPEAAEQYEGENFNTTDKTPDEAA
ncbi:mucin-associated surface protein (MASP), putative, partial [Trypanosoma cruzi marinkellei]